MTDSHDQLALALSVGMNAAAEVARRAGHVEAAICINRYKADWLAKVRPALPRQMVRGDILPPDAARFAIAADFGLAAPPSPSGDA
jgi:hypothetical protein